MEGYGGGRAFSRVFQMLCLLQIASLTVARQSKLMQIPVMSMFSLSQTSSVPRVIHQSWKSSEVPPAYKAWQQSWIDQHPHWQYNLWTDEMNRQLVEEHFRWFLPIYNGMPMEIFRADSVRYMYMYQFGGVYADLDFRALKPMDALLVGSQPQAVVGALSNDTLWDNNFPNAWLASSPRHPFWMYCLMEIAKAAGALNCEGSNCLEQYRVESTTGPMMLWRAIRTYAELGREGKDPQLRLLDPMAVYPLNWRPDYFDQRCEPERLETEEDCYKLFKDSFAITYWSHAWGK